MYLQIHRLKLMVIIYLAIMIQCTFLLMWMPLKRHCIKRKQQRSANPSSQAYNHQLYYHHDPVFISSHVNAPQEVLHQTDIRQQQQRSTNPSSQANGHQLSHHHDPVYFSSHVNALQDVLLRPSESGMQYSRQFPYYSHVPVNDHHSYMYNQTASESSIRLPYYNQAHFNHGSRNNPYERGGDTSHTDNCNER